MKILHFGFREGQYPNYTMNKAIEKMATDYNELDWLNLHRTGARFDKIRSLLIQSSQSVKPDIIFCQIQNPDVLDIHTVQQVHGQIVNWTGDVRTDISWYSNLAPHIGLTLFTNTTDVDKLKAMGINNVDYLQIGYDHILYNYNNVKGYASVQNIVANDIVFCGNNYMNSNLGFPLSELRRDMIDRLVNEFYLTGEKSLRVHGGGWNDWERHNFRPTVVNNVEEFNAYASSRIAINLSHFDYGRYSSDRLLRILGSGTFCLSHHYKDIEKDFEVGYHLDTWKTLDELVDKIKYWLLPENEEKRNKIALNGYVKASTECTWDNRMSELKLLLEKYNLIK